MRSLLAWFLLPVTLSAQHTFSIVAVDPATGEVGSAGASCIGGSDIIAGLLPGRGAMNAQAWVCIPNINLQNGLNWMSMGASPTQVLDSLFANDECWAHSYDTAYRQYGIADFDSSNNPRSAAFTGHSADDFKGHVTGPNYAIQGNILLGQQILDSMEAGFLYTPGSLADRLMAAMQGANVPGADTRCLAGGTSSLSSFIKVAKPEDTTGSFYLDIVIPNVPGGVEPIDTLQTRFDAWKISLGVNAPWATGPEVTVTPNPASSAVSILVGTAEALTLDFYSATGQRLLTHAYAGEPITIVTSELGKGVIYYRVSDRGGVVKVGSFVVL
jgi:uncharacterized Ntn-hydrolase superfamily protein